jgi:hypothetical protein
VETRRKFDEDFKRGAGQTVRETGRPIVQVAREHGISERRGRQLQCRAAARFRTVRHARPGLQRKLKDHLSGLHHDEFVNQTGARWYNGTGSGEGVSSTAKGPPDFRILADLQFGWRKSYRSGRRKVTSRGRAWPSSLTFHHVHEVGTPQASASIGHQSEPRRGTGLGW